MRRIICSFILFASAIGSAQAQNYNPGTNPLRAELFYGQRLVKLELGQTVAESEGTVMNALLSYQFGEKFYLEAGYETQEVTSNAVNGVALNEGVGAESDSTLLGLGFRQLRQGTVGKYWGLGFRSISSGDSDAEATKVGRIYTQKDTTARYGVIAFERSQFTGGSTNTLTGTHVWFLQSGLGLGVNWSMGGAAYDAGPNEPEGTLGISHFGFVLMYRP